MKNNSDKTKRKKRNRRLKASLAKKKEGERLNQEKRALFLKIIKPGQCLGTANLKNKINSAINGGKKKKPSFYSYLESKGLMEDWKKFSVSA